VADRLPLSTLLSHVLVAFTIEFDNEFERRMPHRTTWGPAAGSGRGPWLVSMPMWSNFMRLLTDAGAPLAELEPYARMTNLAGLQRWGYVEIEPDPADDRPHPPRRDWLVRPTRAGGKAQQVWQPLAGEIEQRWRERFGDREIDRLRRSLQNIVDQLDPSLPHYLPVLSYSDGMRMTVPDQPKPRGSVPAHDTDPPLDLAALLSALLIGFTRDLEQQSDLSLAIGANVLRVLDRPGVRVRDLPRRTGTSKAAVSASVGFLSQRHYVTVETDPATSRTKLVRLTTKGLAAQAAQQQLLDAIEAAWRTRFGDDTIGSLRASLLPLVGEPTAQASPLFVGLPSYPEGWRAAAGRPDTLPHHPVVLHRGGFPDGS
jgi:DNA-binding MarR family transcriptional regulator